MSSKKTKVLLLFSGGLDSILAAKILQNADCEVTALTFETPFFDAEKAREAAKNLGIEIIVKDISQIHFKLLRDPPHGFGKNMNPCIDCHGLMFSLAKKIAAEKPRVNSGVNFEIIASGEVLGQRPFSQNRNALQLVEKISGLKNKILRPLSAKLLPETSYEKDGLITREQLLDFSGRNRKPQLALAAKFGIREFPAPAGGCLLTDPGFSARLEILLARDSAAAPADAELLKIGRFLPVGERSFAMIGRNFSENEKLQSSKNPEIYLAQMREFVGPTALIRIKKPDSFEKVFPEIAKKIQSYGRDSKEFSGKITFEIWGKISATREI